jgi:hypothetical protein
MDRENAITQAKVVAQENNLGPANYQSAATFHTDSTTQIFIELEAGGKTAFVEMIDKKLYMPYTWQVRHFKEFEKNESLIIFTPDGKPYGFKETISEDMPGAQLSENQALKIAEQLAAQWNINLIDYKLVETSQKKQPSERVDHILLYERIHETIGEGFYRLKIYVCGDNVTEITHHVKVPETFLRRYTEMRSANHSIAWAAMLLIGLLYVLGGCGLGLYVVFKQHWAMWKQPIKWGFALAAAQTLTQLNQLPSLWMYYPTAHTTNNFLIQLLLSFFSSFILQCGVLTIIIMAAESLTRKAFGNHPQLWSLWIPRNAASYSVLGRTWGGYLLVGFMSAFVVAFYAFSTRYLQWWIPSSTLFDPNILATYIPWLAPITQSLNAGFIEECLFRAIPLASAALLGNHYGKRNLFVGIAFIVQALIFGAAHANYATQPAYARLIELAIPSFIFGATYLRFGLFPSIITHVIYDLIWFSIPIFVSSALLSKIIIILLGLLPLFIIAYARIRQGYWSTFDENHSNIQWKPEEKIISEPTIIVSPITEISARTKTITIITAFFSLLAWIYATPFKHDGITITKKRQEIVHDADIFLHNQNINLENSWRTLPLFFHDYSHVPSLSLQHIFIWREGKKDLYHKLLNTYLQPVHWTVRYAQFEGDIIQRAQEHSIMFYDHIRHYHKLPESLEGASLTKEQARTIAYKTLIEKFNINPVDSTEISAQETQLPHRKNWLFTFADAHAYPLEKGQARINIAISGDEVTDIARFIHVPESWEREELNNKHKLGIISLITALLCVLLFVLILFLAHKEHLAYAISPKTWGFIFILLLSLCIINAINFWPSIIGAFNTSEPLINQLFQRCTLLFFGCFLKALGLGLLIAYASQQAITKNKITLTTIVSGYGIGIIFIALMAIVQKIIPSLKPLWPDYVPLSATIPIVSAIIQHLLSYISITAYYLFAYAIINQATHYWYKNKMIVTAFFMISGFLLPLPSFAFLPLWIIAGSVIGITVLCIYVYIIRYNSSIIPLIVASISILHIVQQGIFNAYPDAWIAAIVSVCVIACISMIWFKKLNN